MTLFQKLEEVAAQPNGWCTLEKAKALAGMVLATRPAIVVEIGVWSGKSLLPMALACQDVNHGKVIGIDPYSPAASVEGQTGAHAEWWNNPAGHEAMFDLFRSLVKQFALENRVELWQMKSDDADAPDGIGLLHIDGNHSEQAARDVAHFGPRVVPGGFVVLDDLHWEGGGVTKGVELLLSYGFRELYRVQTEGNDWGVFQKS